MMEFLKYALFGVFAGFGFMAGMVCFTWIEDNFKRPKKRF